MPELRGCLNGPALLKSWMSRCHLNQEQTALHLRMDKTMLCKILSGKRKPGLETAVWIERMTGVVVEAWVATEVGGFAETDIENGCNLLIDKGPSAPAAS